MLISSGPARNLIDPSFAEKFQLPLQQVHQPLNVQALVRDAIRDGSVMHCIEPISLQVSTLQQKCCHCNNQVPCGPELNVDAHP